MSAPWWSWWLAGTLLPLAVLWLLFRVALRSERCFGYNRILLLLAPLAAAGWPLLPHPSLFTWAWLAKVPATGAATQLIVLPALRLAANEASASTTTSWQWLFGLYAAGVVLGLSRLAYQGWRLHRASCRLPREVRPGYVLAYTGGGLPTSSFGRTVLWDETVGLTPAEAASVLAHELAHVRQGHTYDVLWLEAWRALLWPNPFVQLLLPALRLTHELLADQAAAHLLPPAAPAEAAVPYPTLLARLALRGATSRHYATLLQPFTFSFTLTRLAMLQNHHPVRRWKQWLVLPVLGGLFLGACQSTPLEEMATPPPPPPPPVLTPYTAAQRAALDSAAAGHIYTYVEQMPQLASGGGVETIVKQIQDNFVYPTGTPQQGRIFASFTVKADGSVGDTKIVRGLAPAYDAAVLAAIQKLPRFVPGKQSGRAVAVSFTVPITFREQP